MSDTEQLDIGLAIQNAVRRDGQGRVMVELARELLRRGHHLTVYAHRVDEELAGSVTVRTIRRAPGPQIVDDISMLVACSRAMRRADHDVACVLGHTALPDCPLVLNVQFSHQGWHASWNRRSRPDWRQRLHVRTARRFERLCVGRADHVIASTPVLASEVAGDARGNITVVPNGVDIDEFGPVTDEERRVARSSLGIPDDAFTVGFLGDYKTPRKGLAPLLEAVSAGPEIEHLVVAARGDDRWLRRRLAALGISERVTVAGFAAPALVMAAADTVAVPSLYEPFSLVAVEATARGVPVVLSRRAGAASLLGEGAVIVDDPEDPSLLRAALDAVRTDASLRDRVVEHGRPIVETLTWASCAARAADVIEDVARGAIPARETSDAGS